MKYQYFLIPEFLDHQEIYDLNLLLEKNKNNPGLISLANKELTGFATGTIGMTGKAFENFGSGTTIQAHNLEGIFTPDQLKSIVNESQQRLSTEVVDKVSALITDNPLQKQMVSLLSQAVDALNKSNRINNTIASSI